MVTDDDDVAKLARRLRFHGSDDKQTFVEVGYNSRLDEMQAAVLRILLPELDGWNAARREAAAGVRAARPRRARRAAADGGRRRARLPPLRGALRAGRRAGGGADRARASARARYYRVPVHRQPATARYADGRSCRAPTRPPAPGWPCRWAPASPRTRSARWSRRARLGRPDQLPPRAGHAPADRGDARGRARGGGHGARLRPDAGAVRPVRHRAHGGRPPPRRPAREQGRRPGQPHGGARALGARAAASTWRWATAPTT